MGVPQELEAEFTRHFEEGLRLWGRAMQTGDTSLIEQDMAANIICYFGRTGADRLTEENRNEIISGMRQSVAALCGCTKRFENRLVRMRSHEEAAVFFEQVVEREGQVLARLLTIETYRRICGRWQCIREVVEHVGT